MISIAFKMIIKKEEEKEFINTIIPQLVKSANENGCIYYDFYQGLENPGEFILHEKWPSKENWNAHLERLVTLLGPKAEGSILPKKLLDYFEKTEDILYKED